MWIYIWGWPLEFLLDWMKVQEFCLFSVTNQVIDSMLIRLTWNLFTVFPLLLLCSHRDLDRISIVCNCTSGCAGSYVTHEAKHFIYFYMDSKAVLLFKSGWQFLPELACPLHFIHLIHLQTWLEPTLLYVLSVHPLFISSVLFCVLLSSVGRFKDVSPY